MEAMQLTLQVGVNGNFFFTFFHPYLSNRRMSAQYELMFITSDDKNNSITSLLLSCRFRYAFVRLTQMLLLPHTLKIPGNI